MEEFWDSDGPYVLAKLADRMVPIPRDSEAEASLYSLCRAWVRNNPSLPLLAEAPSPQHPDPRDLAARTGGTAGTTTNGDGLQAGTQPQRALSPPPQGAQQSPQQPQAPPPDSQPDELLSILPPVLSPTPLETETTPPTYPLDDFDAQEPEEALRKFKQHWTAVRHYHQAIRAAKLSRHRERLLALLGEPSLLQPQVLQMQMQASGLVINPQQFLQQQQLQQLHQAGVLGLPAQVLLEQMHHGGMAGLSAFSGAGLVVGSCPGAVGVLPTSMQGGPIPGVVSFGMAQGAQGLVAGGAGVSTVADAQAALATIMNLGPPIAPGAADASVAAQHQQQQLLQLQQEQQQLGPGAGAAVDASGQIVLPPYDMVMSLQQQQQQQLSQQPVAAQSVSVTVGVSGQPPLLGQLSAAVAAAVAEVSDGQGKVHGQQLSPADTDVNVNVMGVAALPSTSEAQEVATAAVDKEQEAHVAGTRSVELLKSMDIDSGSPPSS